MKFLLVLLALLILSVVSSFASRARRFRQRARFVTDYTLKKGYRLRNPAVQDNLNSSGLDILRNPSFRSHAMGSEGITDIPPFQRGSDDPFAFICNLKSKEVTIFNFEVSSQRADGSAGGTIRYKAAKLRVDGLPRFSLGPRSLVHSVGTAVHKLIGQPDPTVDVDVRMNSDFASHYWLEACDRDVIFNFLSPEKLAFIADEKLKGNVAANIKYLVYWEDGPLKGEKECDSFILTVDKIIAHLL